MQINASCCKLNSTRPCQCGVGASCIQQHLLHSGSKLCNTAYAQLRSRDEQAQTQHIPTSVQYHTFCAQRTLMLLALALQCPSAYSPAVAHSMRTLLCTIAYVAPPRIKLLHVLALQRYPNLTAYSPAVTKSSSFVPSRLSQPSPSLASCSTAVGTTGAAAASKRTHSADQHA